MDPIYVFAGAGLVVAVFVWLSFNRLMALDERCNTAFADIDVHLKRRHNIIPNLVETVRAFAGHELAALTEVTTARANALNARQPDVRLEAEMLVGQSLNSLMTIVESYPDLKASAHFRDLRSELVDAENRITASRRFYNLSVDEFNATLRQFPGNMIGGAGRLDRRKHFDLGIERMLIDEPSQIRL